MYHLNQNQSPFHSILSLRNFDKLAVRRAPYESGKVDPDFPLFTNIPGDRVSSSDVLLDRMRGSRQDAGQWGGPTAQRNARKHLNWESHGNTPEGKVPGMGTYGGFESPHAEQLSELIPETMKPDPFTTPVAPDHGADAKAKAVRWALIAAAGGLGLGAGVTGLRGILGRHKPTLSKEEEEIQLPVKRGADERIRLLSKEHLRGDAARSPMDLSWGPTAIGGAGLGAALGGSALVNYILHKRMKAKGQEELEESQKAYQQSLMHPEHKIAAALDKLAADDNNLARPPQESGLNRFMAGPGLGVAIPALLGTAALSGYGAYHWGKSRSKEELLQKALKQRAYLESLRSPQPVHVNPISPDDMSDTDK